MSDPKQIICRLAPSPTGELHLGNIWSFLIAWLAVRQTCGKLALRIDDIDPDRSRQIYTDAILRDLTWMGLDWDDAPCFQSDRLSLYSGSVEKLRKMGVAYACFCSRRELRMLASAPHRGDAGSSGICGCRNMAKSKIERLIASGHQYSIRLASPDKKIIFNDIVQGHMEFDVNSYGGDFALIRSDGVPSYQLATAVDDAAMDMNLVIRGADLLDSTPRQLLIMEYLKLHQPRYAHIPLLLDDNGERLAKRHASLSVRALRERGISPEAIYGVLAHASGLLPENRPCALDELCSIFEMGKLPQKDIRINTKDIL